MKKVQLLSVYVDIFFIGHSPLLPKEDGPWREVALGWVLCPPPTQIQMLKPNPWECLNGFPWPLFLTELLIIEIGSQNIPH